MASRIASAGALFALAWFVMPAPVLSTPLYADDFESYSVGAYPSPPWTTMFYGQSGAISDAQAHSLSKSFRIESYPWSARWECVWLPMVPDHLEYSGWLRLETAGRGCGLGFGYEDPNQPGTGWAGNTVWFGNDGVIYFYSRSLGMVPLASWVPGTWYCVRVKIDYGLLRANVYIDDVLVGDDLATEPKVLLYYGVPVPLDQFGFMADNFQGEGTSVHYLDDVTVVDRGQATGVDPIVRSAPWSAVKGLYR